NFAGVGSEFPVILTEFGWNGWGKYDGNFYKYLISYMNKHGFHYTGWGWWVDAKNPAFPCLIDNWSGTPINGGKVINDDFQSNPGTPMGPVWTDQDLTALSKGPQVANASALASLFRRQLWCARLLRRCRPAHSPALLQLTGLG